MADTNAAISCDICHNLWLHLRGEAAECIDFGSIEDIKSCKCTKHGPLIRAFVDYSSSCNENFEPNISTSKDIGIRSAGGHSITLSDSISNGGIIWDLLLVYKDAATSHSGTGRILDPDWVDLDVVKTWMHDCLTSHGTKCRNPMKIWPVQPAWLIDVENKCVVPGHDRGDFIALSYRWGDHPAILRSTKIMSELQEPSALINPEIKANITPIIWHAMYLTSVLGKRYLWADALCIDHGDRSGTTDQLELMGAIFANALVTIVAADGDCQDGIVGLKDVSPSRKLKQRVIPFGEDQLIVRNTGIFSMDSGTPYYDRAWTYQEHTMSKRKILFNRKEVHWECQCNVWHEELTVGSEVAKYIDPRFRVILAGFPDLDSLQHGHTKYNQRNLTYDEDALPGIAGLLSVTSRTFEGGFLYGLPEMFFDSALAWRPIFTVVDLERRKASDRSSNVRSSFTALPSWSWIGWQGLAGNGYGEAARINPRQTYIEETFPITKWYTAESPEAPPSSRRRIRSTWFENRATRKDLEKPLPAGWTIHEATDKLLGSEPHLYPQSCGTYVFKHQDMPDDDSEAWYYPFPVVKIDESTPPVNPVQTPYIFCETKKVQLWAHWSKKGRLHLEDERLLDLRNKSCSDIGFLYPHNLDQLQLFPKTVEDDALGKSVDLVAICESHRHSKTLDEEQKRWTFPVVKRESIIVLWVEEHNGVSYRIASGFIEKDAWTQLNLEDVSLVLG